MKISFYSLFLVGSFLYANQSDPFGDLLKEIDLTTKIATKNKIASTYAPGIITILQGDDLKRMGIKDFYDALRLIPSTDIDISSTGTQNIVTRGIGGITGSGKTKIMINGVGQNIDASGIFHINLPIDIIERIEVIRGPASALYGEYAFSGVINIITKNSNEFYYGQYSSSYTTGLNYFYNQDNLSISTNISYINDNGIDNLTAVNSIGQTSDINTQRESQNLISIIKYKDFKANIALNKAKKGEFYGLLSTMPQDDDQYHFIYDYKNIELSNKFHLNDKLYFEPKVGYFKYDYWFNSTIPNTIADIKYAKNYVMVDGFYDISNHQIISGVEHSHTNEKSNTSTTELNRRDLMAIYIQDNIKTTSKLTTNFGIRYEKYDDKYNSKLTSTTLPRIATVYNLDDTNIYKLQYAKAYRPPSFNESADLKPENIYTYELQHIYNKSSYKIQTTLFYSIVEDLIVSVGPKIYSNKEENIISRGIELEYNANYKEFLVSSNISYTDAYEQDSKIDLKNYSKILSNISLSYLPYSKFTTTINARYIGSKSRDISDTRDDLKAQMILDIVFKYLPVNQVELSFGIKNFNNSDIQSPSETPMVYPMATLQDDFMESQREYFTKLVYKF